MEIKDVRAKPLSIKLRIPYQSAKKADVVSQPNLNTVIVELICDDGTVGYGEASFPLKIPESPEMVAELFETKIKKMLIGENPFNIEHILRKISGNLNLRNFVLAAVDIALHDIVGKALGTPVYNLFGGKLSGKKAIPSSLIPLLPPEEAARVAENYLKDGVTVLKMKVGDDPEKDFERVKAIREAVGDKISLNLDVGESWITAKRSKKIIKMLERVGVEYIEQPVLANDIEGLKEVTRSTEITIVADESVKPELIFKIINEKAADMLALKIMGLGGIRAVQRYSVLAEEGGLECNIGTYVAQTCILDAAGLHLFLSAHPITVSELGRSVIFLENSPIGGLKIEGGELKLSEEPGLGVSVNL